MYYYYGSSGSYFDEIYEEAIWWNFTATNNATLTILSEGSHTIKVYANDTAGNIGVSSILYFTVDNTLPALTIQQPTNGSINTNWFNITATDANGIDSCWYNQGGSNQTLTNSSGNWNYQNTTLIDGIYTVNFYCNDMVSNENISSIIFTYDTTPLIITIINPANTTVISDNFNVTFNEAPSWSAYSLDNAANVSMGTNISYNTILAGILDGSHNIIVYANDTTGNMNSTTRHWTRDTTNPVVTIVVPTSETTTNHTPLLNVTVNELSNLTYNLDGGGNTSFCTSCLINDTVLSYLTSTSHSIIVYGTNAVGLTGSANVSFIVFDIDIGNPAGQGSTSSTVVETTIENITSVNETVIDTTRITGSLISMLANKDYSSILNSIDGWLDFEFYKNKDICIYYEPEVIGQRLVAIKDLKPIYEIVEGDNICKKVFSITLRPVVYLFVIVIFVWLFYQVITYISAIVSAKTRSIDIERIRRKI